MHSSDEMAKCEFTASGWFENARATFSNKYATFLKSEYVWRQKRRYSKQKQKPKKNFPLGLHDLASLTKRITLVISLIFLSK